MICATCSPFAAAEVPDVTWPGTVPSNYYDLPVGPTVIWPATVPITLKGAATGATGGGWVIAGGLALAAGVLLATGFATRRR